MKKMTPSLLTTLVGAFGGFLGFLFSEFLSPKLGTNFSLLDSIVSTGRWTALIMVPLTLTLLIADNILGLRGRWSRDIGRVLFPALLLGAISGVLAQAFYSFAQMSLPFSQQAIRGLGWGIMGIGVGLSLGLADSSWNKAWRGAIGGLIGGTIGGLVFDKVTSLNFGEQDTGVFPRMIGLTILGAAIGFMLRLSQELFKNTWLLGMTSGPYEGRQYIMMKDMITVGGSRSQDLSLHFDNDIIKQLGTFIHRGNTWIWDGDYVQINGSSKNKATLVNGDQIKLGNTVFLFCEKGNVVGHQLNEQLMLHSNEQAYMLPMPLEKATLGATGTIKIDGENILPKHVEMRVKHGDIFLDTYGPISVNSQTIRSGTTIKVHVGDVITLGSINLALLKERL